MKKKLYLIEPQFYVNSVLKSKQSIPLRKKSDFERSLNKAVSGHYPYFLLPENYLDSQDSFYLKKIKEKNLKPVFSVKATSFSRYKKKLHSLNKSDFLLNIIFQEAQDIPLSDLKSFSAQTCFTFILNQKNKSTNLREELPPFVLDHLEVYSPYKISFLDPFLTPRQVYRFVKNYNKQNKIQAFSSEIYDKRIPLDIDLEPCIKPFAENRKNSKEKIKFSIIIPSYNNKKEIGNTLKYLTKQDYSKSHFEIIVVDDGSTDNTSKELKNFLNHSKDTNLKLLHLPRYLPKKSGEARFRAGIARNLGSKYAKGEILAFLDADILTPPSYLKQLEQEHKKADVILLERYHLRTNTNREDFSFNHKKLKPYLYIEDEKYWGDFYSKGFQNVSVPWKYICSYGLSLTQKDFINIGQFSKNFLFYGFEDTDLGYRLFKANKKFLLSQTKVYHQPLKNKKNIFSRYRLLSKTAKIFFYKHLDPLIYEELKIFMKQERGLSYFFPFLKTNSSS